ncbi:MAG: cysteine peptidase family C39 domain-containing protein, partial [Candidatus Omnitrophica bacterium]|nr:cysteine peptidase family C39 domain-containing protein [Candidatus Omnitrophota bacterium]
MSNQRIEELFEWLKGKPCGSKAIFDYLNYAGIKASEEDVAIMALTTDILNEVVRPEGNPKIIKNSLYALSQASKFFGLDLYPVKIEDSSVIETMVPFIAHLNLDHYILVSRISKDRVYYVDNHKEEFFPIDTFLSKFTGYALTSVLPAGVRVLNPAESKTILGAGRTKDYSWGNAVKKINRTVTRAYSPAKFVSTPTQTYTMNSDYLDYSATQKASTVTVNTVIQRSGSGLGYANDVRQAAKDAGFSDDWGYYWDALWGGTQFQQDFYGSLGVDWTDPRAVRIASNNYVQLTRGEIAAVYVESGVLVGAEHVNSATAGKSYNSKVQLSSDVSILTANLIELGYNSNLTLGSNVYAIATGYDFSVDVINNYLGSTIGTSNGAIKGAFLAGKAMSFALLENKDYYHGFSNKAFSSPIFSRNVASSSTLSLPGIYNYKGTSVYVNFNMPLANATTVTTDLGTVTRGVIPWFDRIITAGGINGENYGKPNFDAYMTIVRSPSSGLELVQGSWFGSGDASIGMARQLDPNTGMGIGKFSLVTPDPTSFSFMGISRDLINDCEVFTSDGWNSYLYNQNNIFAANAIERFTNYSFSDINPFWNGINTDIKSADGKTILGTLSLEDFGEDSGSIPGLNIVARVGSNASGTENRIELPINQYAYGAGNYSGLYLSQITMSVNGMFAQKRELDPVSVQMETIDFSTGIPGEAFDALLPRFRITNSFTDLDSSGASILYTKDVRVDEGIYGVQNFAVGNGINDSFHEVYMLGSDNGTQFVPLDGNNFTESLLTYTGSNSIGYTDDGPTFGAQAAASAGLSDISIDLETAKNVWANFDANQNFPAKAFRMFGSFYEARSEDAFAKFYSENAKEDHPFAKLVPTLVTDNYNWTVYRVAKTDYNYYENNPYFDDSTGSLEMKEDMPVAIQDLYSFTNAYGGVASNYAGALRANETAMNTGLTYFSKYMDFSSRQCELINTYLLDNPNWISSATDGGQVVWMPTGYLAVSYNGETRYIQASDYSDKVKAFAGQGLFNLASNDLAVQVNVPGEANPVTVYLDEKDWNKLSTAVPVSLGSAGTEEGREVDATITSASLQDSEILSRQGEGLFNYADNDILVINGQGKASWVNGKEALRVIDFYTNATNAAVGNFERISSYARFGGGFAQTLLAAKAADPTVADAETSVVKTLGRFGFQLTDAQVQSAGLTNYRTLNDTFQLLNQKYNSLYSMG